MQSIILRPDDMNRGDFVTVHTAKKSQRHLLGHPLQILVVDLPYLSVGSLHAPGRIWLDVRKVSLMRVSSAYVESLLPTPCNCAECRAKKAADEACRGGK